jgi:hypothetical protein
MRRHVDCGIAFRLNSKVLPIGSNGWPISTTHRKTGRASSATSRSCSVPNATGSRLRSVDDQAARLRREEQTSPSTIDPAVA